LIERRIHKQKEFFIMDIGAGDFQWAEAVAEDINSTGFTDIKVHIISLRGESADELVERKQIGQCMLYNISACKVEELSARFPRLINKIDVIVSSWCFRHLADPVGTFAQAHDLLKPSTGLFLFDGFFMKLDDDSEWAGRDAPLRMEELLMNTGGRYFTLESSSRAGRRLPVFLFQKNQSTPLQLPLNYTGCEVICSSSYQCGSGTLTSFRRLDGKSSPLILGILFMIH
jgi:SAM-dependent methyltransferase